MTRPHRQLEALMFLGLTLAGPANPFASAHPISRDAEGRARHGSASMPRGEDGAALLQALAADDDPGADLDHRSQVAQAFFREDLEAEIPERAPQAGLASPNVILFAPKQGPPPSHPS